MHLIGIQSDDRNAGLPQATFGIHYQVRFYPDPLCLSSK